EEHPAVLVHEGDLSLTERQLRVSIVGSRDASDSARADARRVARELAARGAVVVSGLAAGIDTAAHEGALEARSPSGTVGRTIAVMGTPLSQPWPPANARLARRIAEYGLLISLAPQVNGLSFTDEERAESLRARNRAIAALGLGSLVMAGKEGSSTLREVAFSLELGHPVLLWHSIVEEGEPWAIRLLENPPLDSQGRPLVQTVSSAADVEEALSPWSTVWWL
ncbi:MAG: DNA-processing protein DprA, partial [Sutterella wadsworthensis]